MAHDPRHGAISSPESRLVCIVHIYEVKGSQAFCGGGRSDTFSLKCRRQRNGGRTRRGVNWTSLIIPGKYLDLTGCSSWLVSVLVPLTNPRFRCHHIATMFGQTALLALALLPFSLGQVNEGFESGWDQTAWPTYAADCNQGGKVTLDTAQAHSGKNSVRVDGGGGYCGHIFFGTTKVPSGEVYVRTWL